MPPVIRYIHRYSLLATLLIAALPRPAAAVRWQALAETSRYQVALDEDSVRFTALGRLAVWMRFVPRGEAQRKAAAAEYGEKNYRSHLEYYELDCSEKSAVLVLIDIFGTSKARLKRMKGSIQPDYIIPGSALDKAAERICPSMDEEIHEDDPEAPDPDVEQSDNDPEDRQLSPEIQQNIQELTKRAQTEPNSLDAWRSLGNACFDADLHDQAIDAYNRALALSPNDTDILNDQGAMYRQKGEFRKALSNFEKAFKIDPGNLESLYNGGYVLAFDLNDIPGALRVWRRYLELDKNSETARQVMSFVERYQKNKKQPFDNDNR
jgi:tetratricopeptide (TPR) repeat protein